MKGGRMKDHWKEFCKQQAAKTAQRGPYYAISVIMEICESQGTSTARLERIRWFLQELDSIIAQKKEA